MKQQMQIMIDKDLVVEALNTLYVFFKSLNKDSSDSDIHYGILASNFLDLLSQEFVTNVVESKIESKITIEMPMDVGAKA